MNQLVSIIIPCYNAEKFIAETIQSVINQTYKNWELIIVNDGSTDSSLQKIEEFVNQEAKIKVFNKNNTGVSDSRNYGLKIAKGDFIAFLDADDVWHFDYLNKQLNLLELSSFELSYTACKLVDEKGRDLNKVIKGETAPSLEDFLIQKVNYNTNPSGVVFNKICFDNLLGFDINLSNNADQDILIQMLTKGYTIGYVDEILWDYRIHNNNMSKNVDVLEKDTLYLFKKCTNQQLFKSFTFKQKCYSKMYLMLAGSWWKNGNNKLRGIYFILLSILNYPPQLFILINKVVGAKK